MNGEYDVLPSPITVLLRSGQTAQLTVMQIGPPPWFALGQVNDTDRARDTWKANGRWHESDRECRYDIVGIDHGDGEFRAFQGFSTPTPSTP